jgi:hypothetical protein
MTRPHPRLVEVADVAVVSVLMKLLAACGVKEPIQKRCSTKDKQSRSETFSHAHQRTAATVAMADVVTRHFSSKSSDISGRLFNEGKHTGASEIPQGTSGHEELIRHPFLEMPDHVLCFSANLLLFLTTSPFWP